MRNKVLKHNELTLPSITFVRNKGIKKVTVFIATNYNMVFEQGEFSDGSNIVKHIQLKHDEPTVVLVQLYSPTDDKTIVREFRNVAICIEYSFKNLKNE